MLEEVEVSQPHGEEVGYLREVVRPEAQLEEVESRGGLHEEEEGVQRNLSAKKSRRHILEVYRRERKQYTTDSLLLSNYQTSDLFHISRHNHHRLR